MATWHPSHSCLPALRLIGNIAGESRPRGRRRRRRQDPLALGKVVVRVVLECNVGQTPFDWLCLSVTVA